MSDLIDRQAAIDAMEQAKERYFDRRVIIGKMQDIVNSLPSAQPEPHYDEWCTDCKEYDKERHCCPRWNRVIRQTLKDAHIEPQWIPCSERLPEKDGYYLTTTCYRQVYVDYWNEDHFDRTEAVIAWMPLPEPYKGGQE